MAKLVPFEYQSLACYGVMAGDRVWRIGAPPHDQWEKQGDPIPLSEVRLLAPCIPSKIVAVGLNYRDHAVELNMEIPTEPILFLKPGTSVCGPEDIIRYPSQSGQVDYEAELGIVIKRRTRDIEPSEAPEYILGYTCVNDVTARDLQKRDGQWTRAKSFDTFCPIGPCIETDLEPTDLRVECLLNGEVKQGSSTANQGQERCAGRHGREPVEEFVLGPEDDRRPEDDGFGKLGQHCCLARRLGPAVAAGRARIGPDRGDVDQPLYPGRLRCLGNCACAFDVDGVECLLAR